MAAVLSAINISVSNPFQMVSQKPLKTSLAPSSPSPHHPQPSTSSHVSSAADPRPKTFKRIRSTLEQSLRTATRSKAKSPIPPIEDEFGAIVAPPPQVKFKDAAAPSPVRGREKDKGKSTVFRRVTFSSKANQDAADPPKQSGSKPFSSSSPMPPENEDNRKRTGRVAGFASFITPSLRQASVSTPALHLNTASQSRPPLEIASSRISGPAPLAPKAPISRHRVTQSVPVASILPTTPVKRNVITTATTPPASPSRGIPSPPASPTPPSGSRSSPLTRSSSRSGALSSGHLPLGSSHTSRNESPIRARSPSTRTRVITPSPSTPRGIVSASASHLPIVTTPTTTTKVRRPLVDSPTTRKESIDGARRPSMDAPRSSIDGARRPSMDAPRSSIDGARRPSIDSPRVRRPSMDAPRPSLDREPDSRAGSPIRARARSPSQRAYAQNRHFNISTSSLCAPATSEQRDVIRTAVNILCKEMLKTSHRNDSAERQEIDQRIGSLCRLERVMAKSSSSMTHEERERKYFHDSLRDGYILCQLMNRVRSSSVVKPDPREDGMGRSTNITKFLAACSSYGLSSQDLFRREDLVDGSSEALARVAHTIIALVKYADAPIPDRSKILIGGGIKSPTTNPYSGNPAVSRAASSTPNFATSAQQPPSSPVRKRWSPSSGLPPVRSDSPNEGSGTSSVKANDEVVEDEEHGNQVQQLNAVIPSPPPRSPLRAYSSKLSENGRVDHSQLPENGRVPLSSSPPRISVVDSARASVGSSVRDSVTESVARQSLASTVMSDTTTYSSLLELKRSNSSYGNKFGTIRTVTTEATSEMPSFTRTEGSSIAASLAEDFSNGRRVSDPSKPYRERRLSETAPDLGRVIEEVEDGSRSSRDKDSSEKGAPMKPPPPPAAMYLGKGKWPDDFMDVMQPQSSRPIAIPAKSRSPEPPDSSSSSTPSHTPTSSSIIVNPPRKLAIVGASRRNDSVEAIPQQHFPRRPSHRAPVLLPKESILRRDASPDGPPPSPKVMIRRQSTKPSPQRNNVYGVREDSNRSSGDDTASSPVPFPQSDGSSPADEMSPEKPRLIRGRFQSEVDGASTRRRPRPSSYDDAGAIKQVRSRFESMVNLGVTSNEKASDILSTTLDGTAVRKTLIVREEGKISTHYQLGNAIGRGQFGTVYRALNLNTGQMVAVKRIPLDGLREEEITQLMKEVDLVKSLSHPSIVKYEGMARDDDTLSIVLEYAENGSLGQTLKAFGKLNEKLVASYVVKILEGLDYLHNCDVVHCDLKAANILTTKNGNVKLSDFGVSLNMRAMERQNNNVAGTPNWMAPEVIELKGASPKSDIWSLGCTVVELLTGRPPYAGLGGNTMSVMYAIVESDNAPIPENVSPLLDNFLRQCFDKDPAKRPDAVSLCEHPWLKKNWAGHKELRPQDSIPFLRRVSVDMQKSEAVRYLSQIEMPEDADSSPVSASPPKNRKPSFSHHSSENDMSPRDHSFVKTTFSKPMICRVCLLNVKKNAVLCAQCSLISHSKCAPNAPPTCDLRAQLLLYAQYAEKGNPASAYTNPIDAISDALPKSPISDVCYVAGSPRTSIDIPQGSTPSPAAIHPPTAFKFLGAFKRSRSNLGGDSAHAGSSSSVTTTTSRQEKSPPPPVVRNKIRKEPRERPSSIVSDSTQGNSSLRSAATAQESFSSRQGTAEQSLRSVAERVARYSSADTTPEEPAAPEPSPATNHLPTAQTRSVADDEDRIPGQMPSQETRRHKRHRDSKNSSGNCSVQ